MRIPALPLGSKATHGSVWRLAGPIMVANVTTPLLGIVDTAVIGRLEHAYYLGAVAIGSTIFTFVFWGFGALRMGTTGLTAQARGAGDQAEVRNTFARALVLAIGLGLAVLALQGPIAAAAFGLFQASETVERFAETYLSARIWAAPATLINYAVIGWLLGMQRAGLTLALQVTLNGFNIVLSVIFVIGLNWGVAGVAWASVAAETIAALIGLVLVFRLVGGKLNLSHAGLWTISAFKRLISVNGNIFIRTLALITVFAVFTNTGAVMGDTVVAANLILLQFITFMAFALDGFAHAAEALIGERIGARDHAGFREAVGATTLWAAAASTLITIAYGLTGPLIIAAMTDIPEVRRTAEAYLMWVVLMPIVAAWAYQLDGVFIGATRTRTLRNAMLLTLAVYLGLVWGLVPQFGNHGLWTAMVVFMLVRAVTLIAAFPALDRSIAASRAPAAHA